MYYLAYGSNLSKTQMARRCPDAKIAGKAMLKDYRLVFRTHATVEKHKGAKTPVLVWDISEKDEKRLDRYEGFPNYYIKQEMEVRMTSLDGRKPKKIKAMIYIMVKGPEKAAPTWDYYNTIAEGYSDFNFDISYLLEAVADAV